MNDILMKVKSIVANELDNIPENGQLSFDCVELMYKLVDIWKDCCEIEEKEMGMSSYDEGYSRDNGYSQRGRMMPRYYEGNSYVGSRMSMGRSGGYSRDDGRQDMVTKLENLMHETHDERDREAIRRMLDGMR